MKKLIISMVAFILVACNEPSTLNVEGSYKIPEGLSDCALYQMTSEGVLTNTITVVRCPLSQTSTTFLVGKQTQTVVVVEMDTTGMGEYLRLKKKFDK